MLTYLKAHRFVLWQFTKRQVEEQYKGSLLGLGWSIISPLLMLLVLTLVFNGIFQIKWPNTEELGPLGFALHVFIGMLVFNLFADLVGRSPSTILSNDNLVTKVVFPLPILMLSQVLASSLNFITMLTVLLLFIFGVNTMHFTAIQIIVLFPALLIFLLGLTLLIATIGVYFRDLKQVITLLTTLLMFLSPVFYPTSTIPEEYLGIYMSNPLAQFMELIRMATMDGLWIPLKDIVLLWAESLLTLAIGIVVFKKLKKGFADVL